VPRLLRKSQVWIMDVFFGFLVFIMVLTLFFRSEINFSEDEERSFGNLQFEARFVSEALLGKGNPLDWTPSNVQELGIADDYIINETRLANMQLLNYNSSKSKLMTSSDYYVFFQGTVGIVKVTPTKEGMGKPGINSTNIIKKENPKDLTTIARLVVFRSQIVKMVLYVWD